MNNLRQAAQQALEELEEIADEVFSAYDNKLGDAILALRAALAEPEQEPVAWIDDSGHPHHISYVQGVREKQLYGPLRPLYTAPTPRNEPVIDKTMAKRIATQLGWEPPKKPLTDEEIGLLTADTRWSDMESPGLLTFARAIERAHGIGDNK